MARSEFRFNKKRKHYAYLHKDIGQSRRNILITTKPFVKGGHKRKDIVNVELYHHPNPKKEGKFYLIPRNYTDSIDSFDDKVYENWNFHKNDKRKVKRIKKKKKNRR